MKSNRWKIIAAAGLMIAAGFCYIRGADRAGSSSDGLLLPVQESSGTFGEELYEAGETAKDEGGLEDKNERTSGNAGSSEEMKVLSEDVSAAEKDGPKLPETEAAGIWIHVCGEVCVPGVYELAAGSRVYQAVEAAGGFTEAAGRDYLNMAQTLEDGMKLVIPDRETAERLKEGQNSAASVMGAEAGIFPAVQTTGLSKELGQGKAGAEEVSAKVNINTASREELMTLKGVGGSRADDIIAYREAHGAFQKIEDIMKVSGIKEASFEKIKEDITV